MRGRALWVTIALIIGSCRDDAPRQRESSSDTIAPIGTGTELLLTRERLAMIDEWIRAAIARDGALPASLDEVRPPAADAERYVPLERFLRDGWGKAIEYTPAPDKRSYDLRSPGEDGALGTGDDVVLTAR